MPLTGPETLTLNAAIMQEITQSAAPPHIRMKLFCERIAFWLANIIRERRDGLLMELHAEQTKFIEECKTGVRPRYSFIPSVQEQFARRLWESLPEDVRQLPEKYGVLVDVLEGYCFVARTQWFVVSVDPEKVMEPVWRYIIDPLPSGILVFDSKGVSSLASVLIIAPISPWQSNYAGMLEEDLREFEAQDAAQEQAREQAQEPSKP